MIDLRPSRRKVPLIPIISLIDILVILLIFFIATTTFRRDKLHVKIALPESKTMGGVASAQEVRTAIVVTKDRKILLGEEEVKAEALAPALKALKKERPEAKLELEADTDAPLGVLVRVWDSLREAGFPINQVPARIQRSPGA